MHVVLASARDLARPGWFDLAGLGALAGPIWLLYVLLGTLVGSTWLQGSTLTIAPSTRLAKIDLLFDGPASMLRALWDESSCFK